MCVSSPLPLSCLPARRPYCQRSGAAVPINPRDDCPGFIWFKGECLFSTLNRFMAFPQTDVRAAPPPGSQYVAQP